MNFEPLGFEIRVPAKFREEDAGWDVGGADVSALVVVSSPSFPSGSAWRVIIDGVDERLVCGEDMVMNVV